MANFATAARFVGALIDLIVLERQLDILERVRDAAYDLADRQVALAEEVVAIHCTLLEKTANYYGVANSAPEYNQQYACAMDVSNTDVKREANRFMNNQLATTDMYSSGLRRDFVETAMAGVVFSSSGDWALAYRNEDELADITNLRRLKHMVDSVNVGSLFTGHATMQRLANQTVDLAASTSRLVESHLQSFVTGVTDWVAGPSQDRTGDPVLLGAVSPVADIGDVGTPFNDRVLTAEPIIDQAANDRRRIEIIENNNAANQATFDGNVNEPNGGN